MDETKPTGDGATPAPEGQGQGGASATPEGQGPGGASAAPAAAKILVFVPAYRCERQVTRVLDQFDAATQRWIHTVLLIDNRSPDGTLAAAIERGRQRLTGCRFVAWRNAENYGLGGSHKVAFQYAAQHGFDYIIVLHGDDQARIQDIVAALERGAHTQVDCLLGARFMRGSTLTGYSRLRSLGNRVYNLLFSAAVGRRVRDLGSGLNLYRTAAFNAGRHMAFPDDLTFNYAMLLASCHWRQRVAFFPISWREADQVSNVRLARQAMRVLGLLMRFALGRDAFLAADMRERKTAGYTGEVVFEAAPQPAPEPR